LIDTVQLLQTDARRQAQLIDELQVRMR
jgi:hypothetical protein